MRVKRGAYVNLHQIEIKGKLQIGIWQFPSSHSLTSYSKKIVKMHEFDLIG